MPWTCSKRSHSSLGVGVFGVTSGNETAASDPIISSGHTGDVPSAAHRTWRAARASDLLCVRSPAIPPSNKLSRNRNAAGTDKRAVTSEVPGQSNSNRNRERSLRGELAPWLMTSGRTEFARSRRAHKNAALFGAQHHLWKLPV